MKVTNESVRARGRSDSEKEGGQEREGADGWSGLGLDCGD